MEIENNSYPTSMGIQDPIYKLLLVNHKNPINGWIQYKKYTEKNDDGKWIPITKDSIPNDSDFAKEYNILMAVNAGKLNVGNPFLGGNDDYE